MTNKKEKNSENDSEHNQLLKEENDYYNSLRDSEKGENNVEKYELEDGDDPNTFAHCSDWEDEPEICYHCADEECPLNKN